ncbi:MAG: hypothetical protein QOC81_2084 [Thermoanaerobaculia bacterium]|jgi:hypothetical protein|nr:hypothetical protein [Thermoanaerobaculia bacterium]
MLTLKTFTRNAAMAGAVTLMLGSSAFAQYGSYPRTYGQVAQRGYANRVVEGTVASVVVARNGQRVRLTNGMDLVVPNSVTGEDQGRRYGASTLRPGDVVRMTVYSREGDGRDARVLSLQLLQSNNGYGRNSNGYGRGNSYFGADRQMNGTIVSVDRRNRSIVVETDRGRTVTVDVSGYSNRNADGYASFRRGDRITITGRMNGGEIFVDDIRVTR